MCSFAYCLPPLGERSLPERWDLAMRTRTALEQAPGLGQTLSSRPCRCSAQSSAVTRRPRRKKKVTGENLVLSLGKQYHFYMCKAFLWRNAHLPLGSLFRPAQACVLLGQRNSCHHHHSCQMSASWKNLGKLLPEGGWCSCSKHRTGRDGGAYRKRSVIIYLKVSPGVLHRPGVTETIPITLITVIKRFFISCDRKLQI